ncbi:MAG TPA: electron transport complex subunit E [Kiritimatiellia bacterium]|jgi:electron transport complex protein RnfE|nr:electron transport complex subunit E [Kiritimatiellia bacterium]HOM58845.1 electron transport complex subunit E [Kiritimatiellia bacterium]HOR98575.1 electron transport complex subunit E [Kiritimatiellia bacterium]HPC49022.1 electron transport complex subunit E [Kiritimatiellia bacterium]HPK36772.1 electron transport complex subunit E [Kiritimatiellia bacterium]
MSFFTNLTRGIIRENPTFRLVLGMCPTLAVTTSLENALGMGLAATFVLVCSNMVISSLRKLIPAAVRIPCYIVIIAAFVTMVDLLMQAYTYALWEKLGIFIPLIVVNCIILGRAEAFASKNGVLNSAADGIGMGIGFTIALSVIATLREFIGNGSVTVWGDLAFTAIHNRAMVLFILPAGGFITLGLILAFLNHLQAVSAQRRGGAAPLPLELDCRHCALCKPVE